MAQTLTQEDLDAIAAAVAAALLATPANKLLTDANGCIRVGSYIDDAKPVRPKSIGADQIALTTSGNVTVGKYSDGSVAVASLTAQQTRDAMKLAPTAGDPASGSVDAHLDEIQAKTGTLGAGTVTAVSPVAASGDVAIDRGYDYYAADGRGLSWTDATPATWPNLTGATAKLYVGALEITGTITNPTGPATITCELSRVQTAALVAGVYSFHIDCTLANTHLILQIRGTMTVS